MERILTSYVRALRAAGVPVSTTEAIESARAVELIGYGDRALLKTALAAVLTKSTTETALHEALFDLFFAQANNDSAAETSSELQVAANDEELTTTAASEMTGSSDAETAAVLVALAQSGDADRIAMAMGRAGSAAALEGIRFATQTGYYARQMLKNLGIAQLETELLRQFSERTEAGDQQAQALIATRAALDRMAREHVERYFEIFGKSATENFMREILADRSISALGRADMARMKIIVARMAKRLAEKHSRRRRVRERGQLDLRRTLRTNAGHDGVPFNLVWKTRLKDRPKIVAICDVSGSVANYVRFLLLFIYALREKVGQIECFAFSNQLIDVGGILEKLEFEPAMAKILDEIGTGSTDYGQALEDLQTQHADVIDRRTTVLILGDGRNNYGDPRLADFADIATRSKRLVWLCPENPASWGSGDSCLLQYQPYCSALSHCATVTDLEHALDEVLLAYG